MLRLQCRLLVERVPPLRSVRRAAALTATRYPLITRDDYAYLSDADCQFFERIVGSSAVLTDFDDLQPLNNDWLKSFRGQSRCALRPHSTQQVSAILKHCNERRLAVCPQGGNTGLVGGSVPVFDEVILCTSRLTDEFAFEEELGVLTCSAGWVLETLEQRVSSQGHAMPLDLGAKGSCQIGGNVSTAAGGVRLLRYGSLHAHVLGLETVLADGTIVDARSALRKDNTGLHESHLFVGAEGQLGVVTGVAMTCVPKPQSVNAVLLACASFDHCRRVLVAAKACLAEVLSSFEFMDAAAMDVVVERHSLARALSPAPFYLLVETSGSDEAHDRDKLDRFLGRCLADSVVSNGTIAQSTDQMNQFWQYRDGITEALLADGHVYKHDFSLPIDAFYQLTDVLRQRLSPLATRVVAYGHLGDGNVHLNVTSSEYSEDIVSRLYPFVYEWVRERRGSVSAEHGLGLAKRNHAHYSRAPAALEQMRRLKRLYDPNRILNPYKTIAF